MFRLLTLIVLYIVFGVVAHVIKTAWKNMLFNIRSSYEASLREISERKRAEAETQALNATLEQRVIERTNHLDLLNRQLEAFSYSVSHDLRAPLRAVSGYTRVMKEDFAALLPEDGKSVLARIDVNIIRMNELIDALLKFSRLGRQGVVKQMISQTKIIDEAILELKPEINERKVDFEIESLPDWQADPALLKHVWVNLISNAIKYSRPREITRIKIGSLLAADPSGPVYFIQDNGIGFDMQYATKLFGVFQRMHSTADFEGSGVGLAIVKNIIEQHGGRIWAESEINKGATFYFTLS
jgi:light-regulated signal transduction histidine kinase (bacteriophytochrome)